MNEQDKTELLELLNVALYDADALIGQSHNTDEIAAYKEHRAKLRKWIHRLSQEEPQEPTLVDCPYCHGAHYARQVCPLAPQAEQAQQEYEDTRKYMEHHYTGGD